MAATPATRWLPRYHLVLYTLLRKTPRALMTDGMVSWEARGGLTGTLPVTQLPHPWAPQWEDPAGISEGLMSACLWPAPQGGLPIQGPRIDSCHVGVSSLPTCLRGGRGTSQRSQNMENLTVSLGASLLLILHMCLHIRDAMGASSEARPSASSPSPGSWNVLVSLEAVMVPLKGK